MKKTKNKPPHAHFFEAVALLTGAVIGAGILGIPAVIVQTGTAIGLTEIIIIGLAFLALNVMMGDIVVRTKRSLQLVGLAERYIGVTGRRIAIVTMVGSIYSALLAYMIGEGAILAALFGGDARVWSIGFLIAGAIVLKTNIQWIARVELLFGIVILSIVVVIAGGSIPSINPEHLITIAWGNLLIPIGVLFFAFGGATAIPQLEEMLPKNPSGVRRAIIVGSTIPIIVYALFALVIVGVTGTNTTDVATVGLGHAIGPWMLVLGSIFAFFTMSTGFISHGLTMQRLLTWDYGWRASTAWLATILVPLALFLAHIQNFVAVLSIAGSVFGAVTAILIVITFWRAQHRGDVRDGWHLRFGVPLGIILITLFSVGGILGILSVFH